MLPLHALRGSEDDKSPENLEVTDVVEGEHGGGIPRDERVEVRLRLEAGVVLKVGLHNARYVCDVVAQSGVGSIISRQSRGELILDVEVLCEA